MLNREGGGGADVRDASVFADLDLKTEAKGWVETARTASVAKLTDEAGRIGAKVLEDASSRLLNVTASGGAAGDMRLAA